MTDAEKRALPPGGQLYVPPAYYQITGDTAVDLSNDINWIAVRFTPEIDMKITSILLYTENLDQVESPISAHIYSHDAANDEPDSSLQNLGDIPSTTGWQQLSVSSANQYQCSAGTTYWLLFKGSAANTYDVTVRRWHTGVGSMFPDGTKCLSSTDSGTNWSQVQQDSKDAMLNMIINGQSDFVPQLYYGRKNGQYVFIPSSGLMEIPEEGVSLDCSGLTADTEYSIYLFDNSGTLTMEASTTERTRSEGLSVKTGDTDKRFLGKIYPKEIQTGKQGPVDVMDRRLVAWPGRRVLFGKLNPFSANTGSSMSSVSQWYKWHENDSWTCEMLAVHGSDKIILSSMCRVSSNNGLNTSFGIDAVEPSVYASNVEQYTTNGQVGAYLSARVSEGPHTIYSIVTPRTTGAALWSKYYDATSLYYYDSVIAGEIHD